MKLHKTILEDVSAVIGFTATCRLAAWFGDAPTHFYVPVAVEDGQLLVNLIGLPAARRLSQEWGGQKIALPRLRDYEDDVRKRVCGRMLEQGFSTREVAVHVRIGERRVQQICQELERSGLLTPIGGPRKNAAEKLHGKSPLINNPLGIGITPDDELLGADISDLDSLDSKPRRPLQRVRVSQAAKTKRMQAGGGMKIVSKHKGAK